MSKSKKYIVITSIFAPTKAVKDFAVLNDWQLIVVGDKKSPQDWEYKNVIYLGPEDQEKLDYEILKLLPWNHYCRKMVGYLYAIQNGAEIIIDTDDDNEPKAEWPALPTFSGNFSTVSELDFYNIYKSFTSKPVWPRGFPLKKVLEKQQPKIENKDQQIGVWQFLADEDPDVDAIYRLIDNTPIEFENNQPVVLEEDTICPFNSQNTAFRKELFPLLYLPSFVTFRFTDILRGLIAQPLMWKEGYKLGFGPATVIQKRNPHDYMIDFESEIPVYLHSEKVVKICKDAVDENKSSLTDSLLIAYKALLKEQIVTNEEVELLKAWLTDIKKKAIS